MTITKTKNQTNGQLKSSQNLESLVAIGNSLPVASQKSEELLSYFQPETRELYDEVTQRRIVVPDISDESQRVEEGVGFYEELSDISGKIDNFMESYNKIKKSDKIKMTFYSFKDKYLPFLGEKTSRDFVAELEKEKGIEGEKFINNIYRDIKNNLGPAMEAYLVGLQEDINNYKLLAENPKQVIKNLEEEISSYTNLIEESRSNEDEIKDQGKEIDYQRVEEGINYLEKEREGLVLKVREYVETRYPSAIENLEESKANREYFDTFMKVIPGLMSGLQKDVLKGKTRISRKVREKGNDFVFSLYKLNNKKNGDINYEKDNFKEKLEALGELIKQGEEQYGI